MKRMGHVTIAFLIFWSIVGFLIGFFVLPQPHPAPATTPNFRVARRLAAPTLHSDLPVTRHSVPVATILCEVSAYSPSVQECDGNPLRTASGKRVYVGGIAADLRVLPFGSIITIPNYNNGLPCTIVDTGSAIKGNRLDVFMWSAHEAIHWGRRRNVKVQVLYVPLP